MHRHLTALIALAASATVAAADVVRTEAAGSVDEVTARLEAAVTGAGATVFATVPHSRGAASVDMELNDATLLIFGNPQLGTPALQQDIHAGLVLPLRVLIYADDDGQTWIAYEEVKAMFDGLEIDESADFILKMEGALSKFASAAAGGLI